MWVGRGVEQDNKKALELYDIMCQEGIAQAFFRKGVLYEHGSILEKNFDKAVENYLEAYERGDQDARSRIEAIQDSKQLKVNYQRIVDRLLRAYKSGIESENALEELLSLIKKNKLEWKKETHFAWKIACEENWERIDNSLLTILLISKYRKNFANLSFFSSGIAIKVIHFLFSKP